MRNTTHFLGTIRVKARSLLVVSHSLNRYSTMSHKAHPVVAARGIAEGVLGFVRVATKVLRIVAIAAVAFLGALDFLS